MADGADDPGRVVRDEERDVSEIVVTGAAGFIGSAVVDALVGRGQLVVAVDALTGRGRRRLEATAARLAATDGVRFVVGDVAGPGTDLRALLVGAGGVVHLAGTPGVQSSWGEGFADHLHGNARTTQAVLEAALVTGVPRVVVASSSSVYGDVPVGLAAEDGPTAPVSPYGVSKLAAESVAGVYAARGVPVVSLRYFTVYGPGQRPDMAVHRLVAAGLGGPAFPLRGDGRRARDVTHVDDAVAATLAALDRPLAPGTVCNVGGGRVTTLTEVRSVLAGLLGREVPVEPVPAAPGDPGRTAADLSRARDLLGWAPRVDLIDGLASQVAWHLAGCPPRPLATLPTVPARRRAAASTVDGAVRTIGGLPPVQDRAVVG